MGQIIWTDPALDDVKEILTFVGKDSPQYAEVLAERLLSAPRCLDKFPFYGQRVPEFGLEELRELIVRPYRIIYAMRETACYIVAVIHGYRDLSAAFKPSERLPPS
jgi:addiction module RelE/StbE family toxin